MESSVKIPIAVVGGYLLGRRRKWKMAMLLSVWLAGRGLNVDPVRLGKEALSTVGAHPAVGKLGGEVKDQLLTAAKDAAVATANSQMNRFADRLQERTESLTAGLGAKGVPGREPADEDESRRPSPEARRDRPAAPRHEAERKPGAEARPRQDRRAADSSEGERPVSRERVATATRKAGSKAEGLRKSAGRMPSKAGAGKISKATTRKPTSRSSHETRGTGDS